MSGQPFRVRFGLDAESNRLMQVADAIADDDAVNLRQLLVNAGVKLAGRVSNLPSPNDPDPNKRPIKGQPYLIKFDLAGGELNRLAIWDDGSNPTGPLAEVDVIEPAADKAAIINQAGNSDPGKPFTVGTGNGAVLNLTAQATGEIKADVTAPGTGYAIGDYVDFPAGSLAWGSAMTGNTRVVVTRLGGPAPLGGWRFVDTQTWLKANAADPDHQFGMEPGDLQITTQNGNEEIKVWTGSAWRQIIGTKDVETKIASLSLFEGTAKQVGGTAVPGAVDLNALPDLTGTHPGHAADALAKVSHYYTWVGTAGYTVQSGDPNGIGRDLHGAIMQVGDWLQIANRGTAAAPNLQWVHIGGDLLAKSRADVLYGINAWVAGNYEKGSLVNYKGALYRATANVLATAAAPDQPGVPWQAIPLTAGVHNVPSDADLPATAPPTDVYLVLNSTKGGNKPALFSFDPGASKWIILGGDPNAAGGKPLDLTGGDLMVSIGCPVGSIMAWPFATAPHGWLICDGSSVNATLYPELAKILATNTNISAGKLPDFRGAFLRGAGQNGTWGDAARQVGSWQEDGTRMPRDTAFTATTASAGGHTHTTDSQGAHAHGKGFQQDHNKWKGGDPGGSYVGYEVSTGSAGAHTHTTDNQGAHTHTVTVAGGDPETRPKNWAVNWIIKAIDDGVRLRQ